MCFVSMLECSSLLFLVHLDGLMLLIVDRCHICFACHFQTVHPIQVMFISISTEINSYFQWHSWISMLRPDSIFPFRSMHMHRISHPAYHDMFCIMLFVHCTWLIVSPFACVLALGRAGRRVRVRGTCWVRLRGSSFRLLGDLCRQDDHTLEITSIFAC